MEDGEQFNFYRERASDFVQLHQQVQDSVQLLDSLDVFLATFQSDLSAVSGHISDLQTTSKDFEARLRARRKIEIPLSELLAELCIPPPLATTILDTDVGEPWLTTINDLEHSLHFVKARGKVKAARDLAQVSEGLRIVATTKIRSFFLALIIPIRTSVTTNIQVLQSSRLLKYHPLYAFLQRNALPVAQELQRAYIASARLYYETGFRRYTRSLGWVKARTVEQEPLIGAVPSGSQAASSPTDAQIDSVRLTYARMDGPGVTLAFLADDKTFVEPVEATFRSMLLVLLDNASAEHTFISSFFRDEPFTPPTSLTSISPSRTLSLPSRSSPDDEDEDRNTQLDTGSGTFSPPRKPMASVSVSASESRQGRYHNQLAESDAKAKIKEDEGLSMTLWKQVMEPALGSCEALFKTIIEPTPPPVLPLLCMIRLNESALREAQKRSATPLPLSDHPTSANSPLEPFMLSIRFRLWPVLQKEMSRHVESLKKAADGGSGGLGGGLFGGMGFGGSGSAGAGTKDIAHIIANRYAILFSSVIALSEDEGETMLFSNLQRLRQELNRLITVQASKIKDPAQSAAFVSTVCESLLQMISSASQLNTHPKAQTELAFWREREEEARRRIVSTRR